MAHGRWSVFLSREGRWKTLPEVELAAWRLGCNLIEDCIPISNFRTKST